MKESYAKVLLSLLIGSGCLLLYASLTNGHNWGGDFSAYIMQARSLTEGTPRSFIESNRFIVQQSSYPMGPVVYPWGFPVLLAPFYAVFGLNIIALKLVGVLCFLSFIFLLWITFQKYHSRLWLMGLIGIFLLNPHILSALNDILSDIPFLLFSTASVVLIGIIIVDKRHLTTSPVLDYILVGVSITGAFLIRTNGILLLVTLAITQLIASRLELEPGEQIDLNKNLCSVTPKSLPILSRLSMSGLWINLTPYVFFICAVIAWEIVLPSGGASHISLLQRVSLKVVIHNLQYYFVLPVKFFDGVPIRYLWYGASIVAAGTGIYQRYRSDYHVIVYACLTILLYILWPTTQGLRYLFPVIPFYCSFAITGLDIFQRGATKLDRSYRKIICPFIVIFVLSCFGMQSIRGAYENLVHNRETNSGPFTETSNSLFTFIKQNTKTESIIIFFKPRVMRMMTGRNSLLINKTAELSRGDYLCLYLRGRANSQVSPDEIARLSQEGSAVLIYENSDFRVYRLMRELLTSL